MSAGEFSFQHAALPIQWRRSRFLLTALAWICAIAVTGFLLYVSVEEQAKLGAISHVEDLPSD
ncbi:hypothetical protein Msil_2792 [Methylocella silvestris BL2]|uniref:Uncharacterized protein n=1 Tax=Methylocella silvestris (strain DSM 15510 / CIP 108128 / LMG 27833 / NCIMB 13906 / BL2) TaxID=395965 RepID=B8ES13_METSB|nr:hypothetical protein [Methylocella silvestris]ACK51711.1 hypothetical protein Msil_2792 [Methylocella silvestris BL2]